MNTKKMKKPFLYVVCALAIGLFCLPLNGCKKEEEAEKPYMTGAPTFELSKYIFRNALLDFEASGIRVPAEDSVTYTFMAKHFTPDSVQSKTARMLAPDSVGTFTVTLKAEAPGYHNAAVYKTVTVIDPIYRQLIEGFVAPPDSITDSRDGRVYYFARYGQLDWFVQNLSWEGAGIAYNNVDAMHYILGGLYSWDQALTGEDEPTTPVQGVSPTTEELAAGPQGVCPAGWHVPTHADWAHFGATISNNPSLSFFDPWNSLAEGCCVDARINGNKLWSYHPQNEKTNTHGWNGLPGGYAFVGGNEFDGFGEVGFWWSATSKDNDLAYYRFINYAHAPFNYAAAHKGAVYGSVRCVRRTQL